MTAWRSEHPTQPGQYLVRPKPSEKLVVGTEEITGERLVHVAYIHGQHPGRLMVLLTWTAIRAKGCGLEFRGPLTTEELVEVLNGCQEDKPS